MAKKKIEGGFYWVVLKNQWEVAKYDGRKKKFHVFDEGVWVALSELKEWKPQRIETPDEIDERKVFWSKEDNWGNKKKEKED